MANSHERTYFNLLNVLQSNTGVNGTLDDTFRDIHAASNSSIVVGGHTCVSMKIKTSYQLKNQSQTWSAWSTDRSIWLIHRSEFYRIHPHNQSVYPWGIWSRRWCQSPVQQRAWNKIRGLYFGRKQIIHIIRYPAENSLRRWVKEMTNLQVDDAGKRLVHQGANALDRESSGFPGESMDHS